MQTISPSSSLFGLLVACCSAYFNTLYDCTISTRAIQGVCLHAPLAHAQGLAKYSMGVVPYNGKCIFPRHAGWTRVIDCPGRRPDNGLGAIVAAQGYFQGSGSGVCVSSPSKDELTFTNLCPFRPLSSPVTPCSPHLLVLSLYPRHPSSFPVPSSRFWNSGFLPPLHQDLRPHRPRSATSYSQ